jgi:hypothetical protein
MPFMDPFPGEPPGGPYPDIYAIVRSKLQRTAAQLPDTDPSMVEQTLLTVAGLLARAPCLGGDYSTIEGLDKTLFDGAAGRQVAAALRTELVVSGALGAGPVTRKRVGNTELQYASPQQVQQTPGARTVEEQWMGEAESLFASLSCVKAARVAAGSPAFFAIVGHHRRHRRGCR